VERHLQAAVHSTNNHDLELNVGKPHLAYLSLISLTPPPRMGLTPYFISKDLGNHPLSSSGRRYRDLVKDVTHATSKGSSSPNIYYYYYYYYYLLPPYGPLSHIFPDYSFLTLICTTGRCATTELEAHA
jgi:hypothetical protein